MWDFSEHWLYKRYFAHELPNTAQVFHLLAIVGIVAGLFCALASVIISGRYIVARIDLFVAVFAFILLVMAEKYNCYRLCNWLAIVVVFFFTFPMLYFICGGYIAGVPLIFFIALVFTELSLDKYEKAIALTGEYILYVAVLIAGFYHPEWVYTISTKYNLVYYQLTYLVFVTLLVAIVLLIHNRLLDKHQGHMEELNRELARRNDSLAQYDRMKSDFLATVAHEINTPLAVIAASGNDTLDLLKEASINLEEVAENQIIIDRRVKLIDNILRNLMDTVAIETDRLPLNRQSVYLPDFLKDICNTLFKNIDVHNNRLNYDFQPEAPIIWLDPQRLEQVMANLLSNACTHTNNGHITIRLTRSAPYQFVSVSDDGEGMDAEIAQSVFKQYASTKSDYWRHGIGLSICRRIVLAHNGEIWAESTKGTGTTVSFSLREDNGTD